MCPLHRYREQIDSGEPAAASRGSRDRVWPYGPCLYLGPRGQRCDRAALEDGFCVLHSPDAIALGPWVWFRRLAAILVIAAILWPLVEVLLEQLSHWSH